MNKNIIVSPSILSCDHTNLIHAIRIVESFNLKWIHLDIMDGDFVPNISFGPKLVQDIKHSSNLFLDTHLMMSHPENFIGKFIDAGSDLITIHSEIASNKADILFDIKQNCKQTGISVNPDTNIETIFPYIKYIDLVLIMGVNPGSGGQQLKDNIFSKIKALDTVRSKDKLNFKIAVDGGINSSNIEKIISSGTDVIVSGTEFFKNPSMFMEIFDNKQSLFS